MRVKPKIALMSYSMDNRPAKGSALYTRKIIQGIIDSNRFDVSLVHFEKTNDQIYKTVNEIIFPKVNLPYGSRFISQLLFYFKYRKNRFDCVHWFQPRLYPFYWFFPAVKKIVTMHGAGDITAPSNFVFSRLIFNFVLTRLNKWVDIAVVDSNDAKLEVVKYYGLPESKVSSIYLGGGENFKHLNKQVSQDLIFRKYSIKSPFILDIARLQPHKNIVRLIKAYELLRGSVETREKLVIVGKPTNQKVEEYDVAKKSKYFEDIIFIDFVSDEDLNSFYSASEMFVFPSLDEGFGLPVLEAMASGTPVITSNISSLPEVGGDATVYINPYETEEIFRAMKKILLDKSFAFNMISRGLIQSRKFTWEKTVTETMALYYK